MTLQLVQQKQVKSSRNGTRRIFSAVEMPGSDGRVNSSQHFPSFLRGRKKNDNHKYPYTIASGASGPLMLRTHVFWWSPSFFPNSIIMYPVVLTVVPADSQSRDISLLYHIQSSWKNLFRPFRTHWSLFPIAQLLKTLFFFFIWCTVPVFV